VGEFVSRNGRRANAEIARLIESLRSPLKEAIRSDVSDHFSVLVQKLQILARRYLPRSCAIVLILKSRRIKFMMLRKHLSGINDASDKKNVRGNYILRLARQKLSAPSAAASSN
jgi:hypothetical protein